MEDFTNDSVDESVEQSESVGVESVGGAECAHEECTCSECACKEESAAKSDEEKPAKKSFIDKLPPKIRGIVEYIQTHEDVRQMVMFFLFACLCGLTQMIVTYALSAGLKLASGLGGKFSWFVFHFDTTAEFIGFLVGSVVGQVLTFVLNRKKTFNMPDYLALRAVMYTILAIIIIIMQTYLGGVVTSACYGAKPEADGFLAFLFNMTGQAVAGIAALIVNFLGNKFFVMRDWGKKMRLANAANESEDTKTEA